MSNNANSQGNVKVPGRLKQTAIDAHGNLLPIAGASDIYDDTHEMTLEEFTAAQLALNEEQAQLNEELRNATSVAPSRQGPYDDEFNGMEKIYLTKNVEEDVETGIAHNYLTQAMFQRDGEPIENAIFVINYDYELYENITIPENCVLKFDGGSISGERTNYIVQNGCNIIGSNCISGIYINAATELHSCWFSDNISFKNSLRYLSSNSEVYFDSIISLAPGSVVFPDNVTIYGIEGHKIMFDDTTCLLVPGNNFKIYNCYFDGTGSGKAEQDNHREVIRSNNKSNIEIIGCTFKNLYGGNRMIIIHLNNDDSENAVKNFTIDNCVFDKYGSYNPDTQGGDTQYISRAVWISGNCKYINVTNCKFYNHRNVSLTGEDIETQDADAICIDGDTTDDSYDTYAIISDNYFENIYTCPIKTFASYLTVQNNRSVQTKHCDIAICRCYNGRNVQIINNSCDVPYNGSGKHLIQVKNLNNVIIKNNEGIVQWTDMESIISIAENVHNIIVDGINFIGRNLSGDDYDSKSLFTGQINETLCIKNCNIKVGRRGSIFRCNAPSAAVFILENVNIEADYVMRPLNSSGDDNATYIFKNCNFSISSIGGSAMYKPLEAYNCSFNFTLSMYGNCILEHCIFKRIVTYGPLVIRNSKIETDWSQGSIEIKYDNSVSIDGLTCHTPKPISRRLLSLGSNDYSNIIEIKNFDVPCESGGRYVNYYFENYDNIYFGYTPNKIFGVSAWHSGIPNIPSHTVDGFQYIGENNTLYKNILGTLLNITATVVI